MANATPSPRPNGWTLDATRIYARSPFAARHDTRAAEYSDYRAMLADEYPDAPAYRLDDMAKAWCAVAALRGGWRA